MAVTGNVGFPDQWVVKLRPGSSDTIVSGYSTSSIAKGPSLDESHAESIESADARAPAKRSLITGFYLHRQKMSMTATSLPRLSSQPPDSATLAVARFAPVP